MEMSPSPLHIWGCADTTIGETFVATNPLLENSFSMPSTTTTPTTTTTSAAPTTTTTNSSSGSDSTRTGNIAGGVVGGIAGLGLIAGSIWWMMRFRRKKAAAEAQATAAAQPMLQYNGLTPPPGAGTPQSWPPPQGHPSGSPYYDPNGYTQGSSPMPYPSSNQTPFDPNNPNQQIFWAQGHSSTTTTPPIGSANSPAPSSQPPAELENNAVGTSENPAQLH